MTMFSKIGRSADLVTGMTRRLGIEDLGFGAQSPDQAAQAFRSAVLRCATCQDQDGCQTLQAANALLDAAPDYCRNKSDLDAAARR